MHTGKSLVLMTGLALVTAWYPSAHGSDVDYARARISDKVPAI